MKFRSWKTTRPGGHAQVIEHELRGRSRLKDGSKLKDQFISQSGKELIAGRKPISWGEEGQGLRIDNLNLFFGAEGPRSLAFESVNEPLSTPLGAKVYLASNGPLYAVVLDNELVVLTPNKVIAQDVRMQIALDGSLSRGA